MSSKFTRNKSLSPYELYDSLKASIIELDRSLRARQLDNYFENLKIVSTDILNTPIEDKQLKTYIKEYVNILSNKKNFNGMSAEDLAGLAEYSRQLGIAFLKL